MASSIDVNPLQEGLLEEGALEPCAVVIFGASGDLTRRMLLPALYNLALDRRLPAGFAVVGVARTPWNEEQFRRRAREAVERFSRRPLEEEAWRDFARGLYYISGEYGSRQCCDDLGVVLDRVARERGTMSNRVFYLAVPPSAYEGIIRSLGDNGVVSPQGRGERGWSRIVVEKPFGRDLTSARRLNDVLHSVFQEEDVYRIDHYLGKETVQNILVFRFANGIFEPVWNRRYVDHVQITVAESLGIEGRGGYYEEAGALRDMVQNHLMQLLSLVAMEPPIAFNARAVRDEKVKVLHAVRRLSPRDVAECTVRGQYGRGWVEGRPVPAYREEPEVSPRSSRETFVALKLHIDNWRWADVPFYLRTGKRLPKRSTEVAIHFKRAPHLLFRGLVDLSALAPNILAMRIQPDEGITLKFQAKVPGSPLRIRPVNMDFVYGVAFPQETPTAYETLLLDCLRGDSTLFTRSDEVEAAWALMTDILEAWESLPAPRFPNYEAGTWGPPEADDLVERDGRQWRRL